MSWLKVYGCQIWPWNLMSVMWPEHKSPARSRVQFSRTSFRKICHLSRFYHCSSPLFVLPAIIAKPPRRSAEFLASFIKIARDRSVISWISADLSCSAPTSPRMPEIISCTKSTTFPLDVMPHKSLKKVIDTHFSCHQHIGHLCFNNYECD